MSMKPKSRVSKRELEAAPADECDFQFDFLVGIRGKAVGDARRIVCAFPSPAPETRESWRASRR
jgi:hypothetical protein